MKSVLWSLLVEVPIAAIGVLAIYTANQDHLWLGLGIGFIYGTLEWVSGYWQGMSK